ncbi:hypothetical protein RJ639_022043 [Escallonia herrerae]|uniref:Dual specificity phosphatase catalytic domain-containing protein n=1 Tax=Escallonia herrerae TaxID=1293975 RepID=A0AA88V667_9ASTE|nr:hypothetical protein RJ639_022043 [Escallonia herrerae]
MDGIDEIFQKQVTALRRAIFATNPLKMIIFHAKSKRFCFCVTQVIDFDIKNHPSLGSMVVQIMVALSGFEVVPDREDFDIRKYFGECFDFIDDARKTGGSVLVHCFMGRSRRYSQIHVYITLQDS